MKKITVSTLLFAVLMLTLILSCNLGLTKAAVGSLQLEIQQTRSFYSNLDTAITDYSIERVNRAHPHAVRRYSEY